MRPERPDHPVGAFPCAWRPCRTGVGEGCRGPRRYGGGWGAVCWRSGGALLVEEGFGHGLRMQRRFAGAMPCDARCLLATSRGSPACSAVVCRATPEVRRPPSAVIGIFGRGMPENGRESEVCDFLSSWNPLVGAKEISDQAKRYRKFMQGHFPRSHTSHTSKSLPESRTMSAWM